MRSNTFGASTLSFLAALAAPVVGQDGPYFTMGTGMPLVLERLDPLMSAGKISNHVHSVVGGNGFAPTMDFAQTQTSTCSTVPVKVDKSNYWMPALYYKSPHNGSFIRVPEKPYHKLYYKYGKHDNTPDLERSEFPKEFRMMTGNAMLRHDDGSMGTPGNELNWQCHQPNYVTQEGTGFPKFTSCNGGGLAATIRFPSCWNGQDFDPANPLAHMDFPTNADGLAGCKAPHNVKRFAEIMIEYWLDVSSFDGDYDINDSPFVLAQGDPTGFGMHADFINGWEVGKLASAMKNCMVGNTGEPLDSNACFGAGALYDSDTKDNCRTKNIIDEDVGLTDGEASQDNPYGVKTHGGILPHLPGCNPIQAGPGDATVQTNCPYSLPSGFTDGTATKSNTGAGSGNDTSSGTGSSAGLSPTTLATSTSSKAATQQSSATVVNQKLTTTPVAPIATATSSATMVTSAVGSPSESGTSTGSDSPTSSSASSTDKVTASDGSIWQSMGCYSDQLNPVRSLGGNPEWWGQQITASNCADHCSKIGMSMSGTENGGQCFCGNSLVNSKKIDASKCSSKCNGDDSQTCGGPGALTVHKKAWTSRSKKSHRHLARHMEIVS